VLEEGDCLRKVDIGLGLGLIPLALFAISQSLALPLQQRSGTPGPGMAPLLLSIGLLILAVVLVASRLRIAADTLGPVAWPSRPELARATAVAVALAVSIALLKPLGYVVSSVILMSFLVIAIERVPFRDGHLSLVNLAKATVLIIGLPALFYLVFGVLLRVRLPGLGL
jgi:Tripartite tricarboxylate transporter TctB family